MHIELENLALIPKLFLELEELKKSLSSSNEKRWLTVNELAKYLGYSRDRIYKIKEEHLLEEVHFYKRAGKILFDRVAIDSWVIGKDNNDAICEKRQIVDNVLSSIKTLPQES